MKERRNSATPAEPTYNEVRAIARSGEALGLGALAELIREEVGDEALVVPPGLREELESLVVRCRLRERFATVMGPLQKARYRAAVRAMFVGPLGYRKTLASAWLATRLGMPPLPRRPLLDHLEIHRETEKNRVNC